MRKIVKEKIKCFTADDERVAILHSGKYIILDDNDHVISNAFDYIEATDDGEQWYIEEGELSGTLNSKGEVIIYPGKFNFDDPYYSNGLLLVIKDELYGYIDEEGNVAIPLKYEKAKAFDGGLAIVRFKGKAGIIDTTGSIVGEIKHDEVYSFQEDLYPVKLNEKWGFINKQSQEVIPLIYDQVYKFHEGLAGVRKGTKWGFIDHEGDEVIPFVSDLVWDFKDGKAKVKKDNRAYYIEKNRKRNKIKRINDTPTI